MVIITCMDTRLVELLPKAMNLKNGDVKIIKNAGAIISQPFGSVMRSVLVAIYELGADEVLVVGHTECGMASLHAETMIGHMEERGVSKEVMSTLENSGIRLQKWLRGFDSVEEGVKGTVQVIKKHPCFHRMCLFTAWLSILTQVSSILLLTGTNNRHLSKNILHLRALGSALFV